MIFFWNVKVASSYHVHMTAYYLKSWNHNFKGKLARTVL